MSAPRGAHGRVAVTVNENGLLFWGTPEFGLAARRIEKREKEKRGEKPDDTERKSEGIEVHAERKAGRNGMTPARRKF